MAASLRAAAAAATRILRPAVLPGERLRRLVHTEQHPAPACSLKEGYRGSQIQQKKEELYAASQLDRRPITTAKKVTEWTATAFVLVAGAVTLGGLATAEGAHKQDESDERRCQCRPWLCAECEQSQSLRRTNA
ncbi:hypothetical protein VPH35_012004 [Triticum aestivum]|uniref:uncharacterized protein n=1 Tax=Triticum aestivum TaxID=4565 RepID=UPI001D0281F4|nr:uncharacterized protein LOC123149822 [Triticum aestivum]